MSLFTSLYSGTSGLQANSEDLSVIGNNIANANTIGFKGGRSAFEDQLSTSLIGDNGQVGMGTRMQAVQRILNDGSLASTGLATDLALQGSGFFVVKGSQGGVDTNMYTRAGQFRLNQDGYLVNLGGLKVQGYSADSTGVINGSLGDLQVSTATSPPKATTTLTLKANLNSDIDVKAAFDPLNATATSNHTTSMSVYDSLGKQHTVDVYFRQTAGGQWEYHALTDGGGLNGGTAGVPTEIGSGNLSFDATGKLITHTQTSNFNPINATQPQALTFNFGTPLGTGSGVDGITQYAKKSADSFQNQDGFAAGVLANVQVDNDGNVIGAFDNGQSRKLGQVAVAKFAAADQLQSVGGNLFLQSNLSGQPTVGAANTGGRGSLTAGALEQSNVDLATEFVRMIAAQRGFQANSKTMQTADQMLSELMTLKR